MARLRFTLTFILIFAASTAAATQTRSDPFRQALSLDFDGSLSIENPNGPITITGSNSSGIVVQGVRTVEGVDAGAVQEGQSQTLVQYSGNSKTRSIRTLTPFPMRSGRWHSAVSYTIRVPRTVHVTVVNRNGDQLRINNISGNVLIRHVNGTIELTGVTGATTVDTVNGNVKLKYLEPPRTNATVNSINGQIEVFVPENSAFEWIAQTLRGGIFSSLPFRGHFLPEMSGRSYRAKLNSGAHPTIETNAITGKAYLLGNGQSLQAAKAIQPTKPQIIMTPRPIAPGNNRSALQTVTRRLLIQPPSARSFVVQLPRFDGNYDVATTLGNIFVGELTGDVNVFTRAGEIILGKVLGSCQARSGGGSLNLGEVFGTLTAQTGAGDVLVTAARRGGTLSTQAGNVQVGYSGGPLSIISGGGDIAVLQAAAPVKARSHSGDITINVDSSAGSQPVEARSIGGNVVLNLPPGYRADIEAIALGPIGEPSLVQSDFAGLEISSERVGDKIRTRAVGKINGGGEKLMLYAEDGTVYLRSRVFPPTR